MVYLLADYKQLVFEYRSKYASLVKKLHFWKTSCSWLFIFLLCAAAMMSVWLSDHRMSLTEDKKSISVLNKKLDSLSEKLEKTQSQLLAAKDEISQKDNRIDKLEQTASSTSKRLIEQLLADR